jgi:hypothetical protein
VTADNHEGKTRTFADETVSFAVMWPHAHDLGIRLIGCISASVGIPH